MTDDPTDDDETFCASSDHSSLDKYGNNDNINSKPVSTACSPKRDTLETVKRIIGGDTEKRYVRLHELPYRTVVMNSDTPPHSPDNGFSLRISQTSADKDEEEKESGVEMVSMNYRVGGIPSGNCCCSPRRVDVDDAANKPPTNEVLLLIAFASFTGFAIVQTVAAILAKSEAMMGDSAAMAVDALTYGFNLYAERLKARSRSQHRLDTDTEPSTETSSKLDDPTTLPMARMVVVRRERRKRELYLELIPPSLSVGTLLIVTGFVLTKALNVLLLDTKRPVSQQSTPNMVVMFVFAVLNLLLDFMNVFCFARARHALGFHTSSRDDHDCSSRDGPYQESFEMDHNMRDCRHEGRGADDVRTKRRIDFDTGRTNNQTIRGGGAYSPLGGSADTYVEDGCRQCNDVLNGRSHCAQDDNMAVKGESTLTYDPSACILQQKPVMMDSSEWKIGTKCSMDQSAKNTQVMLLPRWKKGDDADSNHHCSKQQRQSSLLSMPDLDVVQQHDRRNDDNERRSNRGRRDETGNLNMCSAYTHIFADTIRSIAVIVATLSAEWSHGKVTAEEADASAAILVSVVIFLSLIPLLGGIANVLSEIRAIRREESRRLP